MVTGNIIRKQGLDIHYDPAAVFQNPDAFVKNLKQFFKIDFPNFVVLSGIVIQSKVIRRRGEYQINAIIGQRLQKCLTVGTNYFINPPFR